MLLLSPPPLAALNEGMVLAEMFEGGEVKSLPFAALYGRVAQEMGYAFLDTVTVVGSSAINGIHFESTEHNNLGIALAERVKAWLGQTHDLMITDHAVPSKLHASPLPATTIMPSPAAKKEHERIGGIAPREAG